MASGAVSDPKRSPRAASQAAPSRPARATTATGLLWWPHHRTTHEPRPGTSTRPWPGESSAELAPRRRGPATPLASRGDTHPPARPLRGGSQIGHNDAGSAARRRDPRGRGDADGSDVRREDRWTCLASSSSRRQPVSAAIEVSRTVVRRAEGHPLDRASCRVPAMPYLTGWLTSSGSGPADRTGRGPPPCPHLMPDLTFRAVRPPRRSPCHSLD
jgi:hypothetical protein